MAPLASQLSPASSHDLGLGDHRHGVEVEAVEGLARRQPALGEMALGPTTIPFREFVLGNRRQEAAACPPCRLALGELRPDELDGGKAQLGQHDAEARGVDACSRLHAASPMGPPPTRAS